MTVGKDEEEDTKSEDTEKGSERMIKKRGRGERV